MVVPAGWSLCVDRHRKVFLDFVEHFKEWSE